MPMRRGGLGALLLRALLVLRRSRVRLPCRPSSVRRLSQELALLLRLMQPRGQQRAVGGTRHRKCNGGGLNARRGIFPAACSAHLVGANRGATSEPDVLSLTQSLRRWPSRASPPVLRRTLPLLAYSRARSVPPYVHPLWRDAGVGCLSVITQQPTR
jgi:hypothetical protein